VVRLTKGDPNQSKAYSQTPLEIAKKWQKEGAKLLHLVDLSAALGEEDNLKIIKEIIKVVKIKIEVGGGIRDLKKAEEIVSLGAERVIIGTKSMDEVFLGRLLKSLGNERVAVSVDVVDGVVSVGGWQKRTSLKELDFITFLKDKGVKWIIYTDISRDGTLKGANLEAFKKLSSFKEMKIIVSGGVSNLDDLSKIKKELPFVFGVIVGKALYEKRIDLKEAISIFEEA
jgi:phosphoribosylformimino-5-aminoimidazole carboxamide ribotide isomerase